MGDDTSVFIKVKTQQQAEAWAVVLASMGLDVSKPSNSVVVSGDGRWVVRAGSRYESRREVS
ncbi:hypothetical protein [Streptacidiphilus sp. PAMC 29251]